MVKIAPSILAADYARLADEIARVEEAGANLIHVDVMDGHFVPNLTIGPPVIKALKKVARVPLDVHVMVENPEPLLPALIDAGSDILSVHVEACRHLHRTVQIMKQGGVRASVGLNPATPLVMLEEILAELDMVLLMSVNPGFGGQPFIRATLAKIRALKQRLSAQNCSIPIEIDGGVNPSNARSACEAGADILVVGTAIFGHADYTHALHAIRAAIGVHAPASDGQ